MVKCADIISAVIDESLSQSPEFEKKISDRDFSTLCGCIEFLRKRCDETELSVDIDTNTQDLILDIKLRRGGVLGLRRPQYGGVNE